MGRSHKRKRREDPESTDPRKRQSSLGRISLIKRRRGAQILSPRINVQNGILSINKESTIQSAPIKTSTFLKLGKELIREYPGLGIKTAHGILTWTLNRHVRPHRVGRDRNKTFRDRAKLAVGAHIRHKHTGYDRILRSYRSSGVNNHWHKARRDIQKDKNNFEMELRVAKKGAPTVQANLKSHQKYFDEMRQGRMNVVFELLRRVTSAGLPGAGGFQQSMNSAMEAQLLHASTASEGESEGSPATPRSPTADELDDSSPRTSVSSCSAIGDLPGTLRALEYPSQAMIPIDQDLVGLSPSPVQDVVPQKPASDTIKPSTPDSPAALLGTSNSSRRVMPTMYQTTDPVEIQRLVRTLAPSSRVSHLPSRSDILFGASNRLTNILFSCIGSRRAPRSC